MYELRIKPISADGSFSWEIVAFQNALQNNEATVINRGAHVGLDNTLKRAQPEFERALRSLLEPVRHDFDCSCGAQLVIEARRSRQSPYSWDSPREITCQCQRTFGVKLNFVVGQVTPTIEHLPRS